MRFLTFNRLTCGGVPSSRVEVFVTLTEASVAEAGSVPVRPMPALIDHSLESFGEKTTLASFVRKAAPMHRDRRSNVGSGW